MHGLALLAMHGMQLFYERTPVRVCKNCRDALDSDGSTFYEDFAAGDGWPIKRGTHILMLHLRSAL